MGLSEYSYIGTRGCRHGGIAHSHFIQFLASPHGSSRFSFLPLLFIYHAHGPAGFALSSFPVFCIPDILALSIYLFSVYGNRVHNRRKCHCQKGMSDQFRTKRIACRGGGSCHDGVQNASSQGYVTLVWYMLPVFVHFTFYMLLFSAFHLLCFYSLWVAFRGLEVLRLRIYSLPTVSAALSKIPTSFMFRRSSIISPPARLDILRLTILCHLSSRS
jgi:hypothetical protein